MRINKLSRLTRTMPLNRWLVLIWVLAVVGSASMSGQNLPAPSPVSGPSTQATPVKNPRAGDPQAIRTGTALFRMRCASCHGRDATGAAAGSDLTALLASGVTDEDLFRVVRRGVSDTLLPHSFGPNEDVWAIVAYLRTLNTSRSDENPPGSAENGQRVFSASCGSCHRVDGRGGVLGPDLSQIGSQRSRAALAHKIRHASAYFVFGYEPVTLGTGAGQRVRGVKKNEDAFSIQIMRTDERLEGHVKANLRDVINDDTSVMPDFGREQISDRNLNDLLRYLTTLRGENRKPSLKED